MKRKIITIDKALCDGCGNCVSTCSEGALQLIEGKATLVKEDFCDGFGDCIGECPTGALKIEERDSKPFDIDATKEYLLKTRGEEAVRQMEEAQKKHEPHEAKKLPCGCPGSLAQVIDRVSPAESDDKSASCLRNWPVQIHLLPQTAPYYQKADLLIAADCCAYSCAGFHQKFIKGHTVAIGCPKLDNTGAYREKLTAVLRQNDIKTISIAFMEVPCCAGLVRLVEDAVAESGKQIPVKKSKIGIKGQIIC
ncbi:MAG TPA: 4Fe-4S dicluster domain-containing protein [Thermodesulfovibrionales bacterium]|nr:4Fe-4S dicluster domain-containing protein [Thermodesulfovibrionales bacterium]